MTKQTEIKCVIALIRDLNEKDFDFCTRMNIAHSPLRYKVEEDNRIEIWSDNRGSFFFEKELLAMCNSLNIEIMCTTRFYQKPNGEFRDYPAAVLYF